MLLQEPSNLRLSSSWLDFSDTMDHEVPQMTDVISSDSFVSLGLTSDFYSAEQNIVPKPEPMAMPHFGNLRLSETSTTVLDTCVSNEARTQPPQRLPLKEGQEEVSFCVEWTHKKGKRKPQQFWVYCEENQENYLRAYVQIDGQPSSWNNFSAVAKLKGNENTLIFIQNMKQPGEKVDGLEMDISSMVGRHRAGHWGSYPRDELVVLSESDFKINLQLIADDCEPLHPEQGYATTVHVVTEGYTDVAAVEGKFLPLELTYRYLFKNRSKGWFRVQATMEYCGHIIVEGRSDLFMFNNPRMVKKKDLVPYQSDEIKFMQCYALASQRAGISDPAALRAEWTRLGAGSFAPARLEEMLDKAYLTLTQKRKKGTSTPKKVTVKKNKRATKLRSQSALGKRTSSVRAQSDKVPQQVDTDYTPVGPLAKRRRAGVEDVAVPSPAPYWYSVLADSGVSVVDAMDTSPASFTDEQMDELVDTLWRHERC